MTTVTNEYEFQGHHFLASIYDTDVHDGTLISETVKIALSTCGANIIGYTEYVFDNGAITFCYLLSESHCTVHTYPEHKSMWIDVFTCGTSFQMNDFRNMLIETLHIGRIQSEIIERR